MDGATDPRAVVLVEGDSDRAALAALAARRGQDLAAAGVVIVPIGGAKNIRAFLRRLGPPGLGLRLTGLCDAGEEGDFRRGLERAGVGARLDRGAMEALGFYVCDADLEEELIRALGVDRVERIIAAEGELASLRTLRRQPAQRGRAPEQHLHRFIGTRSGRKLRYARLLVEALDPAGVPRALDRVLAHAVGELR